MADLTLDTIAEDLSLAMEIDGDYGYTLAEDSSHLLVEHYGEDGEIDANYRVDVKITKLD